MLFDKLLTDEDLVIKRIVNSVLYSDPLLVSYINQHCFNVYYKNISYRNLVEKNFTLFADGFGIFLINKFLKNIKYRLFNASDLYSKVFDKLGKKNSFFLIGGNFEIKDVYLKCQKRELNIVGYNNGFFSQSEIMMIVNKINNCNPDILIVGMGVPRQEIIADLLFKNTNCKKILCVGNFLEFYFYSVKRIQKKYRDLGIEWIYRLIQEPKRLWERYLIGIPLFFFRIIYLKIRGQL